MQLQCSSKMCLFHISKIFFGYRYYNKFELNYTYNFFLPVVSVPAAKMSPIRCNICSLLNPVVDDFVLLLFSDFSCSFFVHLPIETSQSDREAPGRIGNSFCVPRSVWQRDPSPGSANNLPQSLVAAERNILQKLDVIREAFGVEMNKDNGEEKT